MSSIDLWPDERLIDSRMFEESESGLDIDLVVLDLPGLHQPNSKASQKLMLALNDVKDTKIFKSTSIQAILRYRWTDTFDYVVKRQLLPYMGFFSVYMFYAIYSLAREIKWQTEYPNEPYPTHDKVIEMCCYVPLASFGVYFLRFEYLQLRQQGTQDIWSYLTTLWNYVDLIPPILIFFVILFDWLEGNGMALNNTRYTLQAVICFFMWMKIFYFLRMWQRASYFVHTFGEVVMRSMTFLGIYFLLVLCFAITFLIGSPDNNQGIVYFIK